MNNKSMPDHPDFLRAAENVGKPDPRNEPSSVLTVVGIRSKTLEGQHSNVVNLVLHDAVPEDVRIQFETTKNLYLYSWFVYRFYPVANHYAYSCLELALRGRFEPDILAGGEKKREHGPGLKRLLSYAIDKGYLKNEHFEAWRRKTEVRARQRTMYETIHEMKRLGIHGIEVDETNIEIKEVDRDHDYLAMLLERLPWLRNHYAHGSKSLNNQVLGTLQIVSEIINQVYQENLSV